MQDSNIKIQIPIKKQNGSLPFNKFEFVVGWLLREFTAPYLFLNALWNPAIRWRSRVYKLAWGGIAYELGDNADVDLNEIALGPTTRKLLPTNTATPPLSPLPMLHVKS